MGASHSRDLEIQDSDQDHHTSDEEHHYEDAMATLNPIKLYLHTGGKSPTATWLTSENLTSYAFIKTTDNDDDDNENEFWMLKVGAKIRVKVSAEMKMKSFGDQRRVDFISNGVWAMKFYKSEGFNEFVKRFEDCLFENTYRCEANEENRVRVYGAAEDSVWEDAEEDFEAPMVRANNDGMLIRSLVLGGLDNSFLVGDGKVQVVRNSRDGIGAKGAYVSVYSGSKKAVLMSGETTMMMMKDECDHGIHQLDIETGKVVREWKFDVGIRDITNDSKGAQLDPCGSTFLGLDGNRLCRWDMRDRGDSTSVLSWDQGHEFAKGTGFECFATTGDGSIVVGSRDGKIRLYSVNSMRQAKTAFRGLGCPITHVDVTYDGKWILGTSDAYLVLLCTLFVDKDGKTKTGFSGRMGNKISAPRLLKLTPLDAHLAGADKFRRAQFSWVTEQGKQERHLVATVGKFSVIWNFQQVKDSSHECYQNQQSPKSCYCYKIVLKDDSIVDSRFMHDKFSVTDSLEAPLVVATSMKVSSFSISAIKRL